MTLLDNAALSWTIYVLRSAGLFFAVVAVVNSFVLILNHVRENRHAGLRRYTIRILLMVPVYALAAAAVLWGSGVIPVIRQVLGFVRELYESVVIFSFLQFVLACASGPDALANRFAKPDAAQPKEPGLRCWATSIFQVGRAAAGAEPGPAAAGDAEGPDPEAVGTATVGVPVESTPTPGSAQPPPTLTLPAEELIAPGTPMAAAQPGSHGCRQLVHLPLFSRCVPPWRSARQMLRWCVCGTLAYVVVGGALAILGLVLLCVEVRHHRVRSEQIWEWSSIFLSLSQALAILSLAELAVNLKEELAPLRPYGKFLSVKMVVFFTFWQGLLLTGLVRANAFNFLVNDADEEMLVKEVINNFLICVEMFVASVYHYRIFPSHDYLTVLAQLRYDGTDVESPASLGRPITTSDVVDIRDIYYTAMQIHRSRSGVPQSAAPGPLLQAESAKTTPPSSERSLADPHLAGVASRRLSAMPRIPSASSSAAEEVGTLEGHRYSL
mmetsp:Transcript_33103/g.87531  ORF Transcript_33103/g.87531 Transcript_33103/m.87531 type:complete len:496 (+) Transcript_33103:71-1558(+)